MQALNRKLGYVDRSRVLITFAGAAPVITVRTVENDADIDTYLEVRNRVHPQTPMPREVVLEDRKKPDHLDLIAERDGVPVGVGVDVEVRRSARRRVRVPDDARPARAAAAGRRHGAAPARVRARACRSASRASTWSCAHDDDDSLGVLRRARVTTRSAACRTSSSSSRTPSRAAPPDGIAIVAARARARPRRVRGRARGRRRHPVGRADRQRAVRGVARASFRPADDPRALVRRARRTTASSATRCSAGTPRTRASTR